MLRNLWKSKPVVFIRAVFEVYGIITTLGALGVSAVLGALVPAFVELALNLSHFQKWVIGIGMFFIALAAILAIVTPVVKRRASTKPPLETDASEELTQLREQVKQLKAERDRLKPYEQRDAVAHAQNWL